MEIYERVGELRLGLKVTIWIEDDIWQSHFQYIQVEPLFILAPSQAVLSLPLNITEYYLLQWEYPASPSRHSSTVSAPNSSPWFQHQPRHPAFDDAVYTQPGEEDVDTDRGGSEYIQ